MNCPKCGQSVEPGAVFCGNCGQPLVPAQSVQQVAVPISPNQTTNNYVSVSPPIQNSNQVPINQVAPNNYVDVSAPIQNPNQTVVSQVFNNPVNTGGPSNFTTPVIAGNQNIAANPAYNPAVTDGKLVNAKIMAIIGLCAGFLGLLLILIKPIPFLIMAFGLLGLALCTISRSKLKNVLSIVGIVVSALALVAGLALWVYAVIQYQKSQTTGVSNSSVSTSQNSSLLTPILTPCFNVKIDSGLNNYSPSGCSFDSASTNEEFTVGGNSIPTLTTANFSQLAKKMLANGASDGNATISSEKASQFAGSPAEIAYMTSNGVNPSNLIAAVVFHQTKVDNIFLIIRVEKISQVPTFGPLESTWQWN
jgi:hypothetical protein